MASRSRQRASVLMCSSTTAGQSSRLEPGVRLCDRATLVTWCRLIGTERRR
jgi:hypothetical protein